MFYISYNSVGLGANMFALQPCFEAIDEKFSYTYVQSWTPTQKKHSQKPEIIKLGTFKKSSADSIIALMKNLHDTLIYKTNACIIGGGIDYLTVASGHDTTKFMLFNTSDFTVIKILTIINQYLPIDKRFSISEEPIKKEGECWEWLHNKYNKRQSKRAADSLR